jgi:hypothetical protein
MDWKAPQILAEAAGSEPTKPTEPSFEGFVGANTAQSDEIQAALDRLAPRGFIALKGGLVLPVEVIELALDLERRGIPLATDADHQFIVPNDSRLTETDCAAITRWRLHLGAAVEYRAPEVG